MLLSGLRSALIYSTAVVAIVSSAPAYASMRSFDVRAQAASTAITQLAAQADIQILVGSAAVQGKSVRAIKGRMSVDEAVRRIADDAGLRIVSSDGKTYTLAPKVAAPTGIRTPVSLDETRPSSDAIQEVIVTAQKRAEKIIDVPVAITALSGAAMDERKIEGGSELLRAVPNVNFSKNNFSGYNFSIRGVGTKATSASSDPAVAVSFNNTPLTRNRLFEAEFLDLERVEVLRGPQGTLYGRNTTAGVVNMIAALPKQDFALDAKIEVGNYKTMRATGMVNVPITDTLGIRVAGQWTNRDGFDYNTVTERRVNGRNLYTTRATVAWEPSDNFKVNAIWQHFKEDDNRSRTGKQLCKRDDPGLQFGNATFTFDGLQYRLSQGCLPVSLYRDDVYSAPSIYIQPYHFAVGSISAARVRENGVIVNYPLLRPGDVFANVISTPNLREISTQYDPVFRAKNDLFQGNIEIGLSDGLTFVSQTSFAKDSYYSSQDFNRFTAGPMFNQSDMPGALNTLNRPIDLTLTPGPTPGGEFCDPQLGCSNTILAVDISTSKNEQWYQEFRLQSDWKGPVNFNIGANYLNFKTEDKYYVMNNMFTLIAQYFYNWGRRDPVTRQILPADCPLGREDQECIYTDPNPIGSINDLGHNYFLSKNGVKITSKSVFGEIYWDAAQDLKFTLGGRFTSDHKDSTQIPTQLLLGGGSETPENQRGISSGGRVNSGYPVLPNIVQKWDSFTGRAVVDWKPNLSFTDETLIYASASHGYKGGGTNPPRVDINPAIVRYQPLDETFDAEYVNAFEIGVKNSFANGQMTLNATAFYYDYKDYQISQIVDRIAYNENFDAITYGLEFEAVWRPTRRLRFDGNIGLLRTRIGDGEGSIDVMNRTAGNPDWVVIRPWIQTPSNCIAPRELAEKIVSMGGQVFYGLQGLCPGSNRVGDFIAETTGGYNLHTMYNFTYDPMNPYDPSKMSLGGSGAIPHYGSGAPNYGRGFNTDLSGHELPNAPRFTFNIGGEYTIPMGNWDLTLRGDYYRQSQSWARIYNTEYDRLRAWDNANLSITLSNIGQGLRAQLYVKNVFNKTPITDAFTNSDDTGLTTNIFTLDPRIWGFSLQKKF